MAHSLSALVKHLRTERTGGAPPGRQAYALLKDLTLTDYGDAREQDWTAFFDVLIELWRSPDPELASLALHWLSATAWMLKLRNGPLRSGFPEEFPIDPFLAASRAYAMRGGDNLYNIFGELQSCFWRLEEAPRPLRRLYDGLTGWLQAIGPTDPRYAAIRPGLVEAAQSAFLPLPAWTTARDLLLRRAESASHDIARSAAAWRIGQFYLAAAEAERALNPALPAMAARLAALDVERPGVAGPFLSVFFNEMEHWRAAEGPEPKRYILNILKHRKADEPNTLPVSNGIDFLAIEMLFTPEDIRELVAIGRRDFAEACAYEAGLDLKTVLGE